MDHQFDQWVSDNETAAPTTNLGEVLIRKYERDLKWVEELIEAGNRELAHDYLIHLGETIMDLIPVGPISTEVVEKWRAVCSKYSEGNKK
jgi:type IV secretory pathway ATPase VirB11/archaellum biosynthesis ATPase